ncbi:MAG: hypothetical protein NTX25_15650 [Proteobacteria bacterium]|nr:hypothetical protein [Pseudomonadota bacterium]
MAYSDTWKKQRSICAPAMTFSPSCKQLWIAHGASSLAPKSIRSIACTSLTDLAVDAMTLSSQASSDQLVVSRRIIPGSRINC